MRLEFHVIDCRERCDRIVECYSLRKCRVKGYSKSRTKCIRGDICTRELNLYAVPMTPSSDSLIHGVQTSLQPSSLADYPSFSDANVRTCSPQASTAHSYIHTSLSWSSVCCPRPSSRALPGLLLWDERARDPQRRIFEVTHVRMSRTSGLSGCGGQAESLRWVASDCSRTRG